LNAGPFGIKESRKKLGGVDLSRDGLKLTEPGLPGAAGC